MSDRPHFADDEEEDDGVSRVQIRFFENSTYDVVMKKYNNPKTFHIPSTDECIIINRHLDHLFSNTWYITSEALDKDTIMVADIRNVLFYPQPRKSIYHVVVVYIEYKDKK